MFLETMALMDQIPMDFFTGGVLGTLFGALLVVGILLSIAFYVYHALAWQAIARKLKYKNPWLAWIPFANIAMIFQLGKIKWGWIFLMLIPVLGWIAVYVLYIIAMWRIFETRKYPGWFSLSVIIPKVGGILYLIALGFIAWKDKN